METQGAQRDHGGNLDAAMARFGGGLADWLDLSTGINPDPYPVPAISADSWAALPRRRDQARLMAAARAGYGCAKTVSVIPMAGAQAAIQAAPWLRGPGRAAVVAPTYNEHAAALRFAGWSVTEVATPEAAAGADLAVVVNPNNPDGRRYDPAMLKDLAGQVGLLIVDESFADATPGLSLAPQLAEGQENIVLLRSFGKFYGLAGLRLGFALARGAVAARLAGLAGPWPVSGPAIEIASCALRDHDWQAATISQLNAGAAQLDDLAAKAGWSLIGGTPLFRSYVTPNAAQAQEALAQQRVWSRIFPYSDSWIRLGLPPAARWPALRSAFAAL